MRIAVVGTGGIGAPLGASLATVGQDVVFLARGAHLTAMRANGLRVEGDRGETVVRPVQATDDPAAIGPVDLVLFCVKLWDVETTGEQIRPLIGGETVVIPLQNGVDASERLLPILGAPHVLGGVAMVTGSIVAPGVVRQTGTHHRIIFGELDGQITPRVERIRDVCQGAGIEAVASSDIERDRWEKFIGLVAISGLCALARRPIGDLRDDPDIAPLIDDAMQEVVDVGRSGGVRFAPDVLDEARSKLAALIGPKSSSRGRHRRTPPSWRQDRGVYGASPRVVEARRPIGFPEHLGLVDAALHRGFPPLFEPGSPYLGPKNAIF